MAYDYTKIASDMPVGGYSVEQLQKIAGQTQPAPQQPTKPVVATQYDTTSYSLTDDELALQQAQEAKIAESKSQAFQDTGTEASYSSQALQAMQAEIDATNKLYAEKLQSAQLEGQGRLGSEGAIQARRGLLGSDFGAAQTQDVRQMNVGVESAIQAEQSAKIAELLGQARQAGSAKYAAEVKAKREGLDSYLSDLATRGETNKKIASERAKHFLTLGVDPTTLEKTALEQIAKAAGVSSASILSAYKDVLDEEAVKEAELGKLNKVSLPTSAQEYEYAKQSGYTGSYNDYQTLDANRKAVVARAGASSGGGLTPYQQFSATQSIAKDTQARTEQAREMARQANLIDESYKKIEAGGDRSLNTQAIITSFNKILDPTSVVRESEYDRTAAGQALISRLEGKVQNILQGGAGVTPETLKEASEIAKTYLANSRVSIAAQNKRAEAMASQFGLNPAFVTSTYQEEAPQSDMVKVQINGKVGSIPRANLEKALKAGAIQI